MALEGTLDVLGLPEILQMISLQNKTGILTVQGDEDIIAVSFLKGTIVAADALNQTVEQGLGQVLASQGLVNPEDFSAVTEEHYTGGQRLIDLLLERGFLKREQLLASLRQQTYVLLLQILQWKEGEFKFYGGDEVSFEEGFSPISVHEVLIRSVDDLHIDDEDDVPRLEKAYKRIPGQTQIKFYGEDGEGPLDDKTAIWFGKAEKNLLAALDGQRSLGEIAGATGLGEYSSLYTLYRLLRDGLAEEVFKEPSATAADPDEQLDISFEELENLPFSPIEPGMEVSIEASPTSDAEEGGRILVVKGTTPIMAERPPTVPKPDPVEEESPPVQLPPVQTPTPRESKAPSPIIEPIIQEPELTFSEDIWEESSSDWIWDWLPKASVIIIFIFTVVIFRGPADSLIPFPWMKEDRQEQTSIQLKVLTNRLDQALRTHFLLEGGFPSDLDSLRRRGLVGPEGLHDMEGNPFAYSALEDSYLIEPTLGGLPRPDQGTQDGIAGDFFLDPRVLKVQENLREDPLVLLD